MLEIGSAKKSRILAVVAHSDDETLGAGGTLRKFANDGHEIFALSFTDGVSSRSGEREVERASRKASADAAAQQLGFNWLPSFDFPDNAMDQIPTLDLAKSLEESVQDLSPDIVITHSSVDLNVDHRAVLEAVLVAFRPLPHQRCSAIYSMEVLSSTEYGASGVLGDFRPTVFVEISETLEAKKIAFSLYAEEGRDFPHPRSLEGIDALAMYRGAMVGVRAAEAFQTIRRVLR